MAKTEYSEADRRRIEKHKVLQEFEKVKKNYLIAVVLCTFLGFFAAHRFYLGDRLIGIAMIITWAVIIGLLAFTPLAPESRPVLWLILAYTAFVFVEGFRIIKITDNKNAEIKKAIEARVYTS